MNERKNCVVLNILELKAMAMQGDLKKSDQKESKTKIGGMNYLHFDIRIYVKFILQYLSKILLFLLMIF